MYDSRRGGITAAQPALAGDLRSWPDPTYRAHGVSRWSGPEEIWQHSAVTDEELIDLVRSDCGIEVAIAARFVESKVKAPLGRHPTLDVWHTDSDIAHFKAFEFLTEAGEGTGALRYMPGSHRLQGAWRFTYDYLKYGVQGESCKRVADAMLLRRTFDSEAVELGGAAGSTLVFDTRGFHAGTAMRHGNRVVAVRILTPTVT